MFLSGLSSMNNVVEKVRKQILLHVNITNCAQEISLFMAWQRVFTRAVQKKKIRYWSLEFLLDCVM